MAAIEDIRDEILDYEEKYGDKAVEHMKLDSVITELAKDVTAEECIAENNQKLQHENEKKRWEWNKLFEKGPNYKQST